MIKGDRYISPGDLAWAADKCPLCYWDKLHRTGAVKEPFAQVLKTTANATERALTVENMARLGVKVVAAFPNRKVRSTTESGWGIAGSMDQAFIDENGHIVIVDAKITRVNEYLQKYAKQLAGYAYCLENPDEGEPLKVSRMGLVVFSPSETASLKWSEGNHAAIIGTMHWAEFPYDAEKTRKSIQKVRALYEGPCPTPSDYCDVCRAVDIRVQRALSAERRSA